MAKKIRIVLSGAGNRALPKSAVNSHWLGWVELIRQSDRFELVAVHDVAPTSLQRIVASNVIDSSQVYEDLETMLQKVACEALLVVNPARYHAQTIDIAVEHGLHVLVEKPLVTNLAEGIQLLRKIKQHDVVVNVVQNWRYKNTGLQLRSTIAEGLIGTVGHVFFRYIRNRENPNYPNYIFQEQYPLLYAMGIHHFDLFRYILDEEIVTISGNNFKPPWSMYDSWTGHNLFMTSENGIAISYTGSISSRNTKLLQESLVVEGEQGTLVNNSNWFEPPLLFYPKGEHAPRDLTSAISCRSTREQYDFSDQYILDNFYLSVRQKAKPLCPAYDSFRSLILIEAARQACEKGSVIEVDSLVDMECLYD